MATKQTANAALKYKQDVTCTQCCPLVSKVINVLSVKEFKLGSWQFWTHATIYPSPSRAHDDNHALAEIMVLVGTDAVTAAASQYGKKFITSERCPGVDLGELCRLLSARGRGAEQG